MSSEQQKIMPPMQTPNKGDIIINPKTQRPVKVGSRTWLKLVKEGLVEGRYSDPNELYKVQKPEEVEGKIKELNKTLPQGQQAVRGRGKYANKIVRRNKRPNTQELTQHTAKTAARTIVKNVDKLQNEDLDEEDLEKILERMILEEMLKDGNEQKQVRAPPRRSALKSRLTKPEPEVYYEEPTNEYDEQEECFVEGKTDEEEEDYFDDDDQEFYEE
jgi:hypothetical protein